jgi:photosystem II stability/assembly factor-like uncharacterized protein
MVPGFHPGSWLYQESDNRRRRRPRLCELPVHVMSLRRAWLIGSSLAILSGAAVPEGATAQAMVQPVPHFSSRRLVNIEMVSRRTGWALSFDSRKPGSHWGVGRTTNGGRSWMDVSPHGAARASTRRPPFGFRDRNSLSLAATSPRRAWLVRLRRSGPGATTWYTANGGKSWARQYVRGNHHLAVSVVANDDNAWLVLDRYGGLSGDRFSVYRRSRGAGRGWARDPGDEELGTPPAFGKAKLGIGVAYYQEPADYGPYLSNLVDVTHTAGRHWRVVHLPAFKPDAGLVQAELGRVGFSSGGRIAVPVTFLAGKPNFATLISRDGGRHWSHTKQLFDPGFDADGQFSEFVNARDGWVSAPGPKGRLQTFYRTKNGGRHWTRFQTNLPASETPPDFVDASTGFAFIAPRMWVTHDGGRHWRHFRPKRRVRLGRPRLHLGRG